MMRQPSVSRDLWHDMELRATTKKKGKEEIKEKLDRSASNERRRLPSGTPGDARDAPGEILPSGQEVSSVGVAVFAGTCRFFQLDLSIVWLPIVPAGIMAL